VADGHHIAVRAPHQRPWRGDRDRQPLGRARDPLHVHAIQPEQDVTPGTRITRGARWRTP